MKALLLAAGEGTRLRPLTDKIPKCLVPINGKPLLAIWFEQLDKAGFTEFLVNTSYLADQVECFISRSPYKDKVSLVNESELLGTAGTLIANASWFKNEPFLFAHADNLCSVDWLDFIQAHKCRPAHSLITMMTFDTKTPESCGIVELNELGLLSNFFEKVKNPPGNKANAAIYLIEPKVLNELVSSKKRLFDFSKDVIPAYLNQIYTWHNACYLRDIGTPESYNLAQQEWLRYN